MFFENKKSFKKNHIIEKFQRLIHVVIENEFDRL